MIIATKMGRKKRKEIKIIIDAKIDELKNLNNF